MPKTNALLPDMGADAVNAVMSDAWKSIAGLQLPPSLLGELQRDYLQGAAALWNQAPAPGRPESRAVAAGSAGPGRGASVRRAAGRRGRAAGPR